MRAEQKRKEHNSAGIKKPSIMVPATTVDELISEMRNVVDDKQNLKQIFTPALLQNRITVFFKAINQ